MGLMGPMGPSAIQNPKSKSKIPYNVVVRTKLTEEDFREVLARAETIQASHASGGLGQEEQAFAAAAEEAGMSREAVEQALRERLQLPTEPPKPGTRVFARSADDCYYIAKVLEKLPTGAKVKFLRGEEHTVLASDLRTCSLLPGTNIYGFWKDWGWCPVTIVSYDEKADRLTVTDWWGTDTVSAAEVRLQPPRKKESKLKTWLTNQAIGFAVGLGTAFAGWWFFLR